MAHDDETVSPTSSKADSKSAAAQKVLRRACDCCRKRKVKCDGGNPCGPCTKAAIKCAYLQPPKKKGPKGLRSARVLHALRRIDEHASQQPMDSVGPADQAGAFGNWDWDHPSSGPTSADTMQQHNHMYGPHIGMSQEQTYFQQMPTSAPQPQLSVQPPMYTSDASSQTWSAQPDSGSDSEMPSLSPTTPGIAQSRRRIAGKSFQPYMGLFFEQMFVIMPVIDRAIYLDPAFYINSALWSAELYSFMCAICAATIVQLQVNHNMPELPPLHPLKATDDFFADECLRERRTFDYIEDPSTLSVMTSFFLFAYFGNHEKHGKAWHYLQETIAFAENLDMDDEKSYLNLEPSEAQWRRRLYWLLFITERAYAIQRRKHARLPKSVQQPYVFETEHPELLNGFNNLGTLFAAVDDNFVRAWRGSRKASLCNEAWLAQTQDQIDKVALALGNVTEVQQLDISVTREWLHVLAWQMGVSNGLMWGEGGMSLDYPIELARKVVNITTGANSLALDSHGIGMEQKLSDIAGCLADVLKCTAGDTSGVFLEGKQYLSILLQQLSSMRGKESRYLKPLLAKIQGLMSDGLDNTTLSLPTDATAAASVNGQYTHDSADNRQPASAFLGNSFFESAGRRLSPLGGWTMADSVGMLRSLSQSGNLGMPILGYGSATSQPQPQPQQEHELLPPREDWQQRRESGRVYEELDPDMDMPGTEGWWTGAAGGVAQVA